MKRISIIIFTFLAFGQIFGQVDENGNPIFNSVATNEKEIGNLVLISNYYTLKNNIENSQSSVYISDQPSLNQVEKAATKLASDFFILTKHSKVVVMIMLLTDPNKDFMTVVMKTNQQSFYPSELIGDITENRATELVKEKYDSTAYIQNDKLYFNGKRFKIISNKDIEEAVWNLIKSEKLNKKEPSDIMLPSNKEIKNYILTESRNNASLDFFTEIKGHEFDGVQIKPGIFTTKQSIALYKWGRACFNIGVNTVEDAYDIYAELINKPLNQREKEYIKSGFFNEWDN